VDRWGAFVDFWELLNEQKAATDWYQVVIPYLKSIDPYDKPIATSWQRPELDVVIRDRERTNIDASCRAYIQELGRSWIRRYRNA